MIRTYIKIAVRNFIKDKFFSAINVAGLCVGIAVVLLITLYIVHEVSYDTFHRQAPNICRVTMHLEMGGNAADLTSTFSPMAKAIKDELPEVKEALRLYTTGERVFKHGHRVFSEDKVLFTDPGFFDVFDFKVLSGNPAVALLKPYQVLLTPALAQKYFDTDNFSRVVGESISIDGEVYEITGIVEEAPANSHFHFTAIASIESTGPGRDRTWNSMNLLTYLLLDEHASAAAVQAKMPAVLTRHNTDYAELPKQGIIMLPGIQALTDIHLYSNLQGELEPTGSITTLYILGSVAIIVLLLACVNFINLVTARSANRAKEVGVRKVLGSASSQLIRQFTLESVAVVFLATLLALGFVELLRRPFSSFSGKELPFEVLLTPPYLLSLLMFVVVLGVLAGSYPAFYLSSFKPSAVLKGKVRAGFRSSKLRNVLVTLQFLISIVLIISTLVVQHQLSFMRSKKLGFDKENVLIIDNANTLSSQQAFINAVKSVPAVNSVASAQFMPIDDYDGVTVTTANNKENRKFVNYSSVDHDYLSVLKYEFVTGRGFSRAMPSDSDAVILNERAASYLFDGPAEGQKLYWDGPEGYSVIGVVRNFNFESLKNEVRPLAFFLGGNEEYLHVRLNPGNYNEAISAIELLWKQQNADVPFIYSFLDEEYNDLFKEETRLGTLFSIFTALALFIACLGLMGLAAYMAEQRRKEISVRKVLGASVAQVVLMMSKDFARLMVIAFVLAVPLAYFVMKAWLDGFAYRVGVSVAALFAGGLVVILVGLLSVSYQAIRAALLNPVESLKEE